jgi:hypothetical protein
MLITKTTSHGEYRAPNTVILTRAVNLTARALQKDDVSVGQITIQADCTILVDFVIDLQGTSEGSTQGLTQAATVSEAQASLVRLGIPLTGQRVIPADPANGDQVASTVRIRCHFYVEPQHCWAYIVDMFHEIRVDQKRLCIDVETEQLEGKDRLSLMPFINHRGCDHTADEFLRNLYRRLPWHTHWLMKDAEYTVTPIGKQGKFSRVTLQPTKHEFGTVSAPVCQSGDMGELLFTHALRPKLFCS